MRSLLLDVTPARFVITRALLRFWKQAWAAPFAPLRFLEQDDPPLPAPDWVRVENRMCGICGSDLHQILLDAELNVAPAILPSSRRAYLGHEMVGVVVEVGAAVGGFQPGDRVVRWGRANDCAARGLDDLCPACARGHRVLCERAMEPMHPQPIGGGFGDQFITPASTLVRVPEAVSDEQAIFIEPLAVALHAAFRSPPRDDDRVLVIGCGTIGLLLIQVLRQIAPKALLVAQAEFPWQADLAREMGADETFLAAEDGFAHAAALTGARLYRGRGGSAMLLGGFDRVFDVVGIPTTLEAALRYARARGVVVLVGVNLRRMRLDLTPVWYQEVDLLGAVGHDVTRWEGERISNFDLAIRWLAEGRVRTDPLLTHTFRLEAYREAIATALDKRRARAIKVAFDLRRRLKPSQ